MQTLVEDIQYAWRSFVKSPLVCVLIVLTLALGIGANAAIFSMIHNILLAPLPFAEGERLIKLETHHPNLNRMDVPVSVPTALDYANQNNSLSHLIEYHQMPFTLLGHGDAANVEAGVVSWDFFEMLGIRPMLGRTFLPGEDKPGSKPLIVLSHQFWQHKFSGQADVVGMNLEMNNAVHQVIGVLPPLPGYPFNNDIWIGSSSCPGRGSELFIGQRDNPISKLYGKLKPGVNLHAASREFDQIAKQLQTQYPESYPQSHGLSNTLKPMRVDMVGHSKPTFYLLMGITALVLLIACANVANLNLARMAERRQELAIRKALGANPRHIAKQVMTESILLSLAGGLLGLLLAYMSVGVLSDFAALYTPLASEIKINASVLLFCLVISVLSGIVSGAACAFEKYNINEALKEGSGNITASSSTKRLRQALLIAQFGLSFVVLTSASLVSLSLYRLSLQDIGFKTDNIVAVDLSSSAANRATFVLETARRLKTLPEITDVAFAAEVPLVEGRYKRRLFQISGRELSTEQQHYAALKNEVSASYHQVLNIPLLQGRYFNERDDQNRPGSILINQAFARQYFANEDPVGQQISLQNSGAWLTIRGVVGDIREVEVNIAPQPTFYVPWIESWNYDLQLLLATNESLSTIIPILSDVVREVDPRQAVAGIKTFSVIKADSLASNRLVGILVSLFAILAFLITLSGLLGVVAFNVSQRKKEIGIRVALGANPKRIRMLFVLQSGGLCAIGLLLGVVVMTLISPLLSHLLYKTASFNLALYFLIALVVAAFAIVAVLFPVRQATDIQPNEALREQ